MLFRFIFSVLIVFFLFNFCHAQTADGTSFKKRRTHACHSLQKMKDGVLIVRLQSNARKIEQLKLMKKGKGISKKRRKKYAEQLKELEAQTQQENELILEAFNSEYEFSEIFFMYDTAMHYLTERIESGYFLNGELQVDSSIQLNGKDYFLVRYGFTTDPGQKRTKGFIVMDAQYEDMVPPFPYKQFQPRLSEAIGADEKRAEHLAHLKVLVGNMDDEFHQYLMKCKYKGWMREEN